MKVPQFEPYLGNEEYEAIRDCFDKNWITEGPKAKEFNKELCEFIGCKYGIFAPNGTLALYLGLRAIGIRQGDEVIVPDSTFIASATSVEMVGATPVFVDVNRDNFQIDIRDCHRVLTDKTKAIMPVHLYGQSANMTDIMNFANENSLLVIEDAAQVLGVRWKGKHCGTFGQVGCFSFFADKTITTGEGGLVITNDEQYYDKLLYYRNQGRKQRGSFIHPEIGYNFRMTDMQMAVGLVQLGKFNEIATKKINIRNKYEELLKDIPQVKFTTVDENSGYIPFRVTLMCEKAHPLMDFIASKDIEMRTFFYPLHKQPCFEYLKKQPHYERMNDEFFPNAIYGFENGVCLPSFAALTEEQIEYVCENIKQFYNT